METVYQKRRQSQTLFCNPFYGDLEAPCNFNNLIASHAADCLLQGKWRATIQHYNCWDRTCHPRRSRNPLPTWSDKKNKAQLALWSSHSLRVGACTTLYSQGFTEMEIKSLLRWKSNAFMTYLRNLAVTSRRHNIAMNDANEIPNFV